MPEKQPEFDGYARDYAELLHDPIRERFAPESRFFFQRKLDIIREFFAAQRLDSQKLRWLDMGCGRGDLLRMGRSLFASCAGCDFSAGMLDGCRDLEVRQQTAADRLPWDDDAFDFVTAVCVFHHVPVEERPALVKEMARVVGPGGMLCIIEHNPLNPVTRLVVSRTPVDANAKLLNAGETRRLLATGGRVIGTRYFLYFPESLHRRLSGIETAFVKIPLGGQYAVFSTTQGYCV